MTALERRRNAASLRAGRQFAEAEAELRQAISDSPTDADAHAELGLTLSMAGRPAEATLSYEAAIALSPNDIFALSNLAATLKLLNRAAEAEAILRQVLALEPENDAALRNLAALLRDSGRWAEAKALYLRAAAAGPRLELSLQAHLGLAPVVRSGVDAEAQRADFVRGLDAFAADPRTFDYAGERLSLPWYYLPYQGVSNRRLLERTAEVVTARVPGAAYAADLAHWRDPRTQGRRIRIAVCSQFLRAHTIGRLYRGLIRDLDRTRFEVVVLHAASSGPDADREALDRLADRAVKLPDDLEGQRTLIAELAPDVLFYPDIGMSAQTWFLAAGRLAPVQATSWGHPETTGLPSIDYFVSCDLIEPEGAEAEYSERLVRLSRLPCAYEPPAPPAVVPRAALRLPPEGVLYGCPQTLFKIHPDFDDALARIAEGDPTGHIVMIGGHTSEWNDVLKARWTASHPGLAERVTFLPKLNHAGFMAHLAHIDVLLDPLHFGSGNTLYEGLALGKPIVTWPGRFARGRIVAGAYAQMGVEHPPVAATPGDYAKVALALGRDPDARARLTTELAAKARDHLFDDQGAVREFGAFLSAAVTAAANGERLPSGWKPAPAETRS